MVKETSLFDFQDISVQSVAQREYLERIIVTLRLQLRLNIFGRYREVGGANDCFYCTLLILLYLPGVSGSFDNFLHRQKSVVPSRSNGIDVRLTSVSWELCNQPLMNKTEETRKQI